MIFLHNLRICFFPVTVKEVILKRSLKFKQRLIKIIVTENKRRFYSLVHFQSGQFCFKKKI